MLDIPYVNEVECKKGTKFVCEIETDTGEKKEDEITHLELERITDVEVRNNGVVEFSKGDDKGMMCKVDRKEPFQKDKKPPQFRHRELECKETEIGENVSW